MSIKLDDLLKDSKAKFDETLKKSIITKDSDKDKSLSSSQLDAKIEKLQEALNKRESKFVKLSKEVLSSKDEIVQCLIKNNERPLNCWDEVKKFEKLVNEIK